MNTTVSCGIIPHLTELISMNSHLKQFALPLLCDFANTSDKARDILWTQGGVSTYFSLLTENYWQNTALNSLSNWYDRK